MLWELSVRGQRVVSGSPASPGARWLLLTIIGLHHLGLSGQPQDDVQTAGTVAAAGGQRDDTGLRHQDARACSQWHCAAWPNAEHSGNQYFQGESSARRRGAQHDVYVSYTG